MHRRSFNTPLRATRTFIRQRALARAGKNRGSGNLNKDLWNAFRKTWDFARRLILASGQLLVAFLAIALIIQVYSEVRRDVLIVDPFSVPKPWEAAGLTPDVIADLIGDKIRRTESDAHTDQKRDAVAFDLDEGPVPDVEIPGTKLGLKTIVTLVRSVFGVNPRHIGGAILSPFLTGLDDKRVAKGTKVTLVVYLTQGSDRSKTLSATVDSDDIEAIAQRAAELALDRMNPYLLAAYLEQQGQTDRAIETVQRILEDPSLTPILPRTHNLWGVVLSDERRYEEATTQFEIALTNSPDDKIEYSNWCNALMHLNRFQGAVAKCEVAMKLDPSFEPA